MSFTLSKTVACDSALPPWLGKLSPDCRQQSYGRSFHRGISPLRRALALSLCSSGHRHLVLNCAALGTNDFFQRTKTPKSREEPENVGGWGLLPCATLTSSDGERHKKNRVRSTKSVLIEQRSTPDTVNHQALQILSEPLPCSRRAMVGTDRLAGPPIQCIGEDR